MALGNEQFLFMLQVWFRQAAVANTTNTPFTLAVQTGLELAFV